MCSALLVPATYHKKFKHSFPHMMIFTSLFLQRAIDKLNLSSNKTIIDIGCGCGATTLEIAKNIQPSIRGEYEITDVNAEYLKRGKLKVSVMNRGTAWLDTGTFSSLMQAGQFVQVIEERQGLKVGCIEECAYRAGFINLQDLRNIAKPLMKSGYGEYLMKIDE